MDTALPFSSGKGLKYIFRANLKEEKGGGFRGLSAIKRFAPSSPLQRCSRSHSTPPPFASALLCPWIDLCHKTLLNSALSSGTWSLLGGRTFGEVPIIYCPIIVGGQWNVLCSKTSQMTREQTLQWKESIVWYFMPARAEGLMESRREPLQDNINDKKILGNVINVVIISQCCFASWISRWIWHPLDEIATSF